jgi:hypothetical protein
VQGKERGYRDYLYKLARQAGLCAGHGDSGGGIGQPGGDGTFAPLAAMRSGCRERFAGPTAKSEGRPRSTICGGRPGLARAAERDAVFHTEFRQDLRFWIDFLQARYHY